MSDEQQPIRGRRKAIEEFIPTVNNFVEGFCGDKKCMPPVFFALTSVYNISKAEAEYDELKGKLKVLHSSGDSDALSEEDQKRYYALNIIPAEKMMDSEESKEEVLVRVRELFRMIKPVAVAFVCESWAVTSGSTGKEIADKILSGELKVRDLHSKKEGVHAYFETDDGYQAVCWHDIIFPADDRTMNPILKFDEKLSMAWTAHDTNGESRIGGRVAGLLCPQLMGMKDPRSDTSDARLVKPNNSWRDEVKKSMEEGKKIEKKISKTSARKSSGLIASRLARMLKMLKEEEEKNRKSRDPDAV